MRDEGEVMGDEVFLEEIKSDLGENRLERNSGTKKRRCFEEEEEEEEKEEEAADVEEALIRAAVS